MCTILHFPLQMPWCRFGIMHKIFRESRRMSSRLWTTFGAAHAQYTCVLNLRNAHCRKHIHRGIAIELPSVLCMHELFILNIYLQYQKLRLMHSMKHQAILQSIKEYTQQPYNLIGREYLQNSVNIHCTFIPSCFHNIMVLVSSYQHRI